MPPSPISWTDTHAHLADRAFEGKVPDVLNRASQSQVTRILSVAVDLATSVAGSELAARFAAERDVPSVWASVGVHPNHAQEASDEDWTAIERLSVHPRVCALGETGLDRHWDDCPWKIQQRWFDRHWDLSRRTGLPLIIHMRDCESDMLMALERQSTIARLRGVMHSFAGSEATAARCVSLGLYISFAGMLTYKKSDELRRVASAIPHDRLLVETDAPYLSPEPMRSVRPNEPCNVVRTADVLAKATGLSLRQLSAITQANVCRLFTRMQSSEF